MNKVPQNLFYTKTHEWVRVEEDETITLGITEYAQHAMGDMVFVDLPEVGKKIQANDECGVLESVKSASDIYSPVGGEIIEINEKLADTPDLVNNDPFGEGWLVKIRPENTDFVKTLMDSEAYQKYLEAE